MRSLRQLTASALSLVVLAACSPESGSLAISVVDEQVKTEIPQFEQVAEQTFSWITEDGGQSQLDFNPQVDILFVTDDSDSMESAQRNLVANIDRFTNGINKNKMIDYNIGVVSTWDSSDAYAKANKDKYQIGELRYIKDSKGQNYNKRFITKKEKQLLASSLNIGVAPLSKGGPETEEFFAPLTAALEKSGAGATNDGFFRPNAQLVVIVMTDAEEGGTRITPAQMAQTLVDFKGGNADKISVYGVLVNAKDPDSVKDWGLRIHPKYKPQCFDRSLKTPKNNGTCTTGFGPELLEEFILQANKEAGSEKFIKDNFILSITNPKFGEELARIGKDITAKTLKKEIFLSERPRVNEKGQLMVRVRYGSPEALAAGKGQVIPNTVQGGWSYDPENNSVVLPGDVDYKYQDGGRFAVDVSPLNLKK